jgi:hypothetical protein
LALGAAIALEPAPTALELGWGEAGAAESKKTSTYSEKDEDRLRLHEPQFAYVLDNVATDFRNAVQHSFDAGRAITIRNFIENSEEKAQGISDLRLARIIEVDVTKDSGSVEGSRKLIHSQPIGGKYSSQGLLLRTSS